MNNLDKLIAYFEKFPGTGARRARRFACHVRTMSAGGSRELAAAIASREAGVTECHRCHRRVPRDGGPAALRSSCDGGHRGHRTLLIVSRDSALQAIERSGV